MKPDLERIALLREVVEKIPHRDLNMSSWTCGTQACAGGWLCRDPRANEMGLSLIDKSGRETPYYVEEKWGMDLEYFGITALAVFLGIDEAQARFIFFPSHYYSQGGRTIGVNNVLAHMDTMMPTFEQLASAPDNED